MAGRRLNEWLSLTLSNLRPTARAVTLVLVVLSACYFLIYVIGTNYYAPVQRVMNSLRLQWRNKLEESANQAALLNQTGVFASADNKRTNVSSFGPGVSVDATSFGGAQINRTLLSKLYAHSNSLAAHPLTTEGPPQRKTTSSATRTTRRNIQFSASRLNSARTDRIVGSQVRSARRELLEWLQWRVKFLLRRTARLDTDPLNVCANAQPNDVCPCFHF